MSTAPTAEERHLIVLQKLASGSRDLSVACRLSEGIRKLLVVTFAMAACVTSCAASLIELNRQPHMFHGRGACVLSTENMIHGHRMCPAAIDRVL